MPEKISKHIETIRRLFMLLPWCTQFTEYYISAFNQSLWQYYHKLSSKIQQGA